MANSNPIKKDLSHTYPDYILSKEFDSQILYITVISQLDKEGWFKDNLHAITLDGIPMGFKVDSNFDIIKHEIGKYTDIKEKMFNLISIIGRIRNGATGNPASVSYSITFLDEKDNILESFSATSNGITPSSFYTQITFKL
jgi:hypothetical protein